MTEPTFRNNHLRKCLISCRGSDGVGHQLEAKLSCIATASVLNDLQYVHSPISSAEHGTDPHEFENFVGLQKSFSAIDSVYDKLLMNDGNMSTRTREPLPRVGKCREPSWFDAEQRATQCREAGEGTVFVADNCWDFFYCSLKRGENVTQLHHALQVLSDSYDERHDPFERLTAVVHIRRADSGQRKTAGTFYSRLIKEMLDHSDQNLDVIVHTDQQQATRFQLLPNLDVKYNVIIRDRSVPLQKAFNDMVQADILVASSSSLSYSAAMLGGAGRPVLCPFDKSRSGVSNLEGWRILRETKAGLEMYYDWKWEPVNQKLFLKVISEARNKRK